MSGRYDLTSFVARLGGDPRMYARAVPVGTPAILPPDISYALELLVRV